MSETKEDRNRRVIVRYDQLMLEGKHGHYETLFRAVREEVEREREACAKLADLQAALDRRRGETLCKSLPDDAQSYEDFAVTAESIAKAIRFRSELEK